MDQKQTAVSIRPTLLKLISRYLCSGVAIPWTMPVILSGFLSTGWQGAVLQFLLLILGVFIYMPFIKMMDKQYLVDEAKASATEDDDDISLDDLSFDDL